MTSVWSYVIIVDCWIGWQNDFNNCLHVTVFCDVLKRVSAVLQWESESYQPVAQSDPWLTNKIETCAQENLKIKQKQNRNFRKLKNILK